METTNLPFSPDGTEEFEMDGEMVALTTCIVRSSGSARCLFALSFSLLNERLWKD